MAKEKQSRSKHESNTNMSIFGVLGSTNDDEPSNEGWALVYRTCTLVDIPLALVQNIGTVAQVMIDG